MCLWQMRAMFVSGPDGKPLLLNNGVWGMADATGLLDGLSGALHVKPASATEQPFILDGELVRNQ